MKLYKSYILAGLIALGFTACDTDDLERDINALKDRVENYEAQVQKLNDDMNIIRVMLDGNKTISEWSYDGSKYTLKLSNGETLTLSNGVVGDTNYPSIEISENGNWVIAGEDTGIRAVAKDGEDAEFTPQFKIENGNWFVSHDDGATWTDLGVKATGTPENVTSPIEDYGIEDNKFKLVLNLDGITTETYYIPIVEGLVCEISEPIVDAGELIYVSSTTPTTFKVKVNIKDGDILRAIVPVGWTATMPNYTTGEQTLEIKVTAPAKASKCKIAFELTRGLNSVTDEVVARTETTSYYDDYMAGLDIEVGGLIINKKTYPNATLKESSGNLAGTGLVFVKKVSSLTLSGGVENLILISDKPGEMPEITTQRITINGNFACYGLKLDGSAHNNYLIGNSKTNIEYFIFDNCYLIPPKGKAFAYCGNTQIVDKLVFKNNFVYYSESGNNILNCSGMSVNDVDFSNNIVASTVETKGQILTVSNNNDKVNLKFTNNTFYNFFSTAQGITAKLSGEITINYNIFYNNLSNVSAFLIKDSMEPSTIKGCYENNVIFNQKEDNIVKWYYFHGESKLPEGAEYTDLIPTATEAPISIPSDISTGDFKSIGAYVNYGAQR